LLGHVENSNEFGHGDRFEQYSVCLLPDKPGIEGSSPFVFTLRQPLSVTDSGRFRLTDQARRLDGAPTDLAKLPRKSDWRRAVQAEVR
jgi:hypothetical protein